MAFLSYLCIIIVCDLPFNLPLIHIPSLGSVRGSRMTSATGRNIAAFRAIPYAKPPIGNLRFRDPEPAQPWTGKTLDATRDGPICIQTEVMTNLIIGQEDCLNVNVYTHGVKDELRPVIFYIHGGSWFTGSGSGVKNPYGARYLLDRDIVLVTFNYRLGPFGFLSTEDAEAPGNYGLLDQNLALRWVRDNIRYFGGNPNLVTIYGTSAGAASVLYHVLSPLSNGLFHRAISESGSMLNPWGADLSVGKYSQALADGFNCRSELSSELLACLRKKSARMIAGFRLRTNTYFDIPTLFSPRVDRERSTPFLPADPKTLIKEKRINSVPIIIGVNKNEGAYLVAAFLASKSALANKCKRDLLNCFRYILGVDLQSNGFAIARRVIDHYFFGSDPFARSQLVPLEQMFSDFRFFNGIDETVALLNKFSDQNIYHYYYTHRSQYSLTNFIPFAPRSIDYGVCHGDIVFMVFSYDLVLPLLSAPGDVKVSALLLDLWTSFAYDGVPQSKRIPNGWIPSKQNQSRYLTIDATPFMMNQTMPFYNRLTFVKEVLNSSLSVGKMCTTCHDES